MAARFTLTSPSIEGRGQLAMEHTCDGNRTPPLLEWSHAPPTTRSLVLRMDDLDGKGTPVTEPR
jgi:phosphatidylethanolamine-binding protein (PEBP) family uncharacterized protein